MNATIGYSQPFYSVRLTGNNFPNMKVKLLKYAKNSEQCDSAAVKGNFSVVLTNSTETEPMMYVLKFEKYNRSIFLISDNNTDVTIDWTTFQKYHLPNQAYTYKGSTQTTVTDKLDSISLTYYDKFITLQKTKDSLTYISNNTQSKEIDGTIRNIANEMLTTILLFADTTQFATIAAKCFYPLLTVNRKYDLNRIKEIDTAFAKARAKFPKSTYMDLTEEGILPEIKIALDPKKDESKMKQTKLPPITVLDNKNKTIRPLLLRNKYTFIDFWASWCGPCRAEIPKSLALKKEIGKNIDFVYLSMDAKPEQWVKASTELELLSQSYSYLLVENTKKQLVEQLQIQFIPRYMIVDQNGIIIESYARRPSDLLLKSQLLKLANSVR